MRARAATRPPGAVGMHFPFVRSLRIQPPEGLRLLDAPPHREWLSLVQYWRDGQRAPVWFLADPTRTDLALVDPAARRQFQRYAWSISTDRFLSGVRPSEARWLTLDPPGWFLEEGWALTPETGGDAATAGRWPAERPIVGHVRRPRSATTGLIGGRNLGAAGDPPVRFTVRVDGRVIDETVAPPDPGFFVKMLAIDAARLANDPGAGAEYARVEIAAAAADGSARPVKAAIEQFDVQPEGSVVFGFGEGWHELEYSRELRRQFRWSSDRATLVVHHAGRDVTLRLIGESPRRYFDTAPTVLVSAGATEVGRFSPASDFDQTIRVPAAALDAAHGHLTIATDRTFVPSERSGSPDRRRLGLRIFSLTVE
jgi:hypothetical protein